MRAGDMWHVCLEGLRDVGSLRYGWRAQADVAWDGRTRFHPGQMCCQTQPTLKYTMSHHTDSSPCSLCALLSAYTLQYPSTTFDVFGSQDEVPGRSVQPQVAVSSPERILGTCYATVSQSVEHLALVSRGPGTSSEACSWHLVSSNWTGPVF